MAATPRVRTHVGLRPGRGDAARHGDVVRRRQDLAEPPPRLGHEPQPQRAHLGEHQPQGPLLASRHVAARRGGVGQEHLDGDAAVEELLEFRLKEGELGGLFLRQRREERVPRARLAGVAAVGHLPFHGDDGAIESPVIHGVLPQHLRRTRQFCHFVGVFDASKWKANVQIWKECQAQEGFKPRPDCHMSETVS